jgi:DNA polymerase I
MKTALLDLDIYIYRAAAASENDSFELAIERLNYSIQKTLARLCTNDYKAFISGSDNFRYNVNPKYKQNRRYTKDPQHREGLKLFAVENLSAKVCHGMEADDALGITQMKTFVDHLEVPGETCICTIDKDLNMIPGLHYNFVTDDIFYVSLAEANAFFYNQLLIGDRADNIQGIDGVGPVKARNLLYPCNTDDEKFAVIRERYYDDARLLMNARCLWIAREKEDEWVNTKHGRMLIEDLGLKTE